LLKSPPKIIWEEPHRTPHGRKLTRLLRVLAVQCPLQTSLITQPRVRHIHNTVPVPHSAYPTRCKVAATRDLFSNGIQIQSVVFLQFTHRTDRRTDRWDRRQVCLNTRIRSIDCTATRQKYQRMHQMDMPMDYHMWGSMLECYQRYTPKLTNIAELKDCFVDDLIHNGLPQELINKATVVSFRNRL